MSRELERLRVQTAQVEHDEAVIRKETAGLDREAAWLRKEAAQVRLDVLKKMQRDRDYLEARRSEFER